MVQLVPLDITNECKLRLGHFYDGGYVILDKGLEDIEVLYTIGVDGNTYFEENWLRKYNNPKFRSELYDHTIDHLPFNERQELHFHKVGLGPICNETAQLKNLDSMITENNDWGNKKFLKLDCEGCEWDSID